MSKNGKKVAEVKKLTPVKKVIVASSELTDAELTGNASTTPENLTPVVNESEPVVEAAETSAAAVEPEVADKVEEPKIVRPDMPADFCMDPADWDSNRLFLDKSNNNCKTCEKDMPECFGVCLARQNFLSGPGKVVKAKKDKGAKAVRTNKNGKTPQSIVIDGYIKAEMTVANMIIELAKADFGGETEPGLKASKGRISSHLNAIEKGTYCRAAEMLPFVAYLKAVPVAAAVAEPAVATN